MSALCIHALFLSLSLSLSRSSSGLSSGDISSQYVRVEYVSPRGWFLPAHFSCQMTKKDCRYSGYTYCMPSSRHIYWHLYTHARTTLLWIRYFVFAVARVFFQRALARPHYARRWWMSKLRSEPSLSFFSAPASTFISTFLITLR